MPADIKRWYAVVCSWNSPTDASLHRYTSNGYKIAFRVDMKQTSTCKLLQPYFETGLAMTTP